MTTEIYILLILGFLSVIKTAIKESLRNSKPTNINYGTINHNYYGFENPQAENKIIMEKNALPAQINGKNQEHSIAPK